LKVLQQLFKWTNVGWTAIALKAVHNDAPSHGLYLMFPKCPGYGFVQLGRNMDETHMEFDVFPAETGQAWDTEPCKYSSYAFCLPWKSSFTTVWDNWLLWDYRSHCVRLTDDIDPSCFVLIPTDKCSPLGKMFPLAVKDKNKHLMKVRWGANRIQPEDLALGIPLRTADISYGENMGQRIEVALTCGTAGHFR
jgi:hypothetical protein